MSDPSPYYCSLDDVNALAPQVPFGPTSKPSADRVTALIAQVARRVDATLANLGYIVPISGEASLALVREACAWEVLGLAQQMRDTGVTTAVTPFGKELKNRWRQDFESWLMRLADDDDPFELPDAPRTDDEVEKNNGDQVRTFVESLSASEFDADHPAVTRDQQF